MGEKSTPPLTGKTVLGLAWMALPMAASLLLILPAVVVALAGVFYWRHGDAPVTGIGCILWSLVVLAESFNYWDGWRLSSANKAWQRLRALGFFIARIGSPFFYVLLALTLFLSNWWGTASALLLVAILQAVDLARRVHEQQIDDEQAEAKRLRQFIDPEQFRRQAEWRHKTVSKKD
jgi:hypothetical protein